VYLHTTAVLVIKCCADIVLVHMQTLGIWLLSDQYASRIGELNLIEQGNFYTLKLSKLGMCTASPLDWSPGLLSVSIQAFGTTKLWRTQKLGWSTRSNDV
jgi:hypothetical protein